MIPMSVLSPRVRSPHGVGSQQKATRGLLLDVSQRTPGVELMGGSWGAAGRLPLVCSECFLCHLVKSLEITA